MKFLCPSCKAKYQIADEKVAGRSVRMKCRKCGFLITISKTVTEGSVSRRLDGLSSRPPAGSSSAPPPPRPPSERAPPPSARPPPSVIPPTKPTPAPPQAAPRGGWREPGAAMVRPGGIPRPPPRPPRPGGISPAPPAVRPEPAPTPSPPPAAPAPRAFGMQPGESSYEPPASHRTGNGASRGNGASYGGGGQPFADEDRTMIASMGALSAAFSDQVHAPDSSALVAASLASTDEWYVGINGVPVGPIRLSELRSKASVGAITVDSLVWREGFEQWMPLSNFPELVAIVEEGLSSAHASVAPLSPPPPTSQPQPPMGPRPEVYDPFMQPGSAGTLADPFGRPRTSANPMAAAAALSASGSSPSISGPVSSPFGHVPLGPAAPILVAEKTEEAMVVPRRSSAPFAWLAVGAALALGLTIGFVMFSRKPNDPVIKYVEVPAKGGETTPAGSAAGPAEVVVEATADGGTTKVARVGGPLPTKPGSDKAEEKPLTGLQGLQGLQPGGPTGGPGGTPSGPGPSGGQLDSTQIQQTVSKYTSGVKRSCWQPALDSRTKDAPTSARVNVTLTIGPSGAVQNVSASDAKGYPGLASCIAGRVRGWQFPASGGTTTVNVPFVFAAQ